jgi:hypothetical protein
MRVKLEKIANIDLYENDIKILKRILNLADARMANFKEGTGSEDFEENSIFISTLREELDIK